MVQLFSVIPVKRIKLSVLNTVAEKRDQPRDTLKLMCLMRSATIALQLLLLAVVELAFGAGLPLLTVMAIISLEIAVNVFAWLRLRGVVFANASLAKNELLAHVLFDVVILALLIAATGGGLNPFTGFFIVPVIIAAISLPIAQAWLVVATSIGAYIVLALQVPDHSQHMSHSASQQLANAHLYGMFFSFAIAAILVVLFVSRLAASLRERDSQLYKAQQLAEVNRQINALGMLAAGAAHELGTPLNSLTLLNKEFQQFSSQLPQLSPLLDMHQRQLKRCRESLDDLMSATNSHRAKQAVASTIVGSVSAYVARWSVSHPDINVSFESSLPESLTLIVDTLLEKAMVNLLDNAARVSPAQVTVQLSADKNWLNIVIGDVGSGIADEVVASLDSPAGMSARQFGFGLFWVKAFSLRTSGQLRFEPNQPVGTRVILQLPLNEV